MSSTEPVTNHVSHGDFPLSIPQEDNKPVEWTPLAIAGLSVLPPEKMVEHLTKMLAWYVKEDDVRIGMPGNEYWEAGYHMAQALLAARELQTSSPK